MEGEGRECFYLTTHSTHRLLFARVLLYASSHRQDNTYHGLCYTSRGALAGTRNSSMGPPHEGRGGEGFLLMFVKYALLAM